MQNYVFSTAKTLLLCNMTSKRLCLFSCLLLFLFPVSHVSQLGSGIFQVKPLQVRNSAFEILWRRLDSESRVSWFVLQRPGVTDLFFYWISPTSIPGYLTIFNLNFNSCRLPWFQRVILVGIFFRKPKTEGEPSAADERRIQNSDTSKIRWIPNCVNNRTSTVPLWPTGWEDLGFEKVAAYPHSHAAFHCRRLTNSRKVTTDYIHWGMLTCNWTNYMSVGGTVNIFSALK